MANSYKKILQLLQQWPVDTTKHGRDLGQYIRHQVKENFKTGEVLSVDEQECNRIHASLKRMVENQYGQKYQRNYNSCASGLSSEECHGVLSTEVLEELKIQDQSFFSKLFANKKQS